MINTGHTKVDAIATLHLEGDITPRSWYKHICYKTSKTGENKVDRLAIDILSDILYWYRPYEKRDEITGYHLRWEKKFKEDVLRRSPEEFALALNATPRCIRESMKVLESLGLVKVIYKSLKTDFGTLPNVMYIDIFPKAIANITYSVTKETNSLHVNAETLDKSLSTKWVTPNYEMSNTQLRNGSSGNTKHVTTDYETVGITYIENSIENSAERKDARVREDHTHTKQPHQIIEVEAEVVEDFSSNQEPIQNSLCSNKSFHEGKSSPGSFGKTEQTDNEKIADRCRRQWEESGYIPKIPVEFEAWASIDLGNDVISIYRKSGRLTTIRTGDIDSKFAMYVASQYKGKDVDYGYQRIKKLEREPENWETLRALVLKWKASLESGRQNINITEEVQAHERKQTKRVRETFDW